MPVSSRTRTESRSKASRCRSGARQRRAGGWARRFFAPVLTAGAALALVGLVGTAAPAFRVQEVFQDVGSELSAQASMAVEAPAAEGGAGAGAPAASAEEATDGEALSAGDASSPTESNVERTLSAPGETADDVDDGATALAPAPAERSPWPMVLFTGVALMVAAALLRWILAPRAG